jgi:hypothetical protein
MIISWCRAGVVEGCLLTFTQLIWESSPLRRIVSSIAAVSRLGYGEPELRKSVGG